MMRRHLPCTLALAFSLLPLAAGVAGCEDVTNEAPGSLRLWLRLPPGQDTLWGAERLRVAVEGGQIEPGERIVEFSVDSGGGSVGALPDLPCDTDNGPWTVLVEALAGATDDERVVARGVSAPVSFPCGQSGEVGVLLAPVDEFVFTAALDEDDPDLHSEMKQPRYGHTTTVLSDGKVMVAGGVELTPTGDITCDRLLDTIEVYDPADGRWHLSTWRLRSKRAFHSATRLRGKGSVLVLGGYGCINNRIASLVTGEVIYPWKLDDRSASAAAVTALRASMFTPRAGHTATLHPQGWVLIAGGETVDDSGRRPVSTLELFFTTPPESLRRNCNAEAAWTFCRTADMRMSSARVLHSAAVVGTSVFLMGGHDGDTTLASSESFFYDATSGQTPGATRSAPPLREARQSMASVDFEGYVFLFGGERWSAAGNSEVLGTLEWYDPHSNSFHTSTDDIGPRAEAAAVVLDPGGWVVVSGGRDARGTALSSAMVLQIARRNDAGDLSVGLLDGPLEIGALQGARYGHAMVLLDTQQVLVAGGASSSAAVDVSSLVSSELLSPSPSLLR